MPFIYETHLHTSQSSACGKTPGRDYIAHYRDLGYQGIIVTDHFYNGNCGVDKSLPWKEFVNRFCAGFEDAKQQGDKLGLDVFFGWEENFDNDEYLIYGLNKDFLLDHPEMIRWTREQQFRAVEQAGGCVVQAHPFRDRDYIPQIHLSTSLVHGVEVGNHGNQPDMDALAHRYAKNLGLPMTAGSDMHNAGNSDPEAHFGVVFQSKLESIEDYVRAIREKQPFGLHIPNGRLDWDESVSIKLPVDIRGSKDERLNISVQDLLKA